MSQLEVNKIVPQSGTSLTYGDNGDTFQIPSGVTLDIASGGTIDATGATITGFDAASDEKVKISSNDTTPGFLNGKLTAGANITLTEGSDGGDETLSIALSGTIPDARFPATLPAASGVNLTALNATNLGSGTVPTARLGSGTASSSTFLAGDQTFKTITGTTINNNANNRLITGSGTANTLEGEASLTFDGTNLGVGTASPDVTLSLEKSNAPKIQFKDTSGGTDAKVWRTMGLDSGYQIETRSDDLASGQLAYEIARSGTTVSTHKFYTGDAERLEVSNSGIDVTGAITVNGAALPGVPSGVILMWHGASNAIPSGYVICDGNNSTPNLTDKFIKASGTANNTGGSSTSGATTLSTSQMPSHKHNLNGNNANIGATNSSWATLQSSTNTVSSPNPIQNTGGGGSHTHSVEPPFYTLIFIMKT